MEEVNYQPSGNANRGRVVGYHSKPSPRELHIGGKKDTDGVKAVRNYDGLGTTFASNYCIGFEIEKTQFHRGAVKEYALFCGFETDSSCGYEAVTNILPLLPPSYWRNKVFDMFVKASKVIEDKYSPSNEKCGGHISLSVEGLSGYELREKMKPYMGMVYAMFRKRLTNRYCNGNLTLVDNNLAGRWAQQDWVNGQGFGGHEKYQVFNAKTEYAELRLPSRVTSVAQLMRRYEMMYLMVDCAMKRSSFKSFLAKAEPIVAMMYEGDMEKVGKIMTLAGHFQEYINKGVRHEDIRRYVPRILEEESEPQPEATRDLEASIMEASNAFRRHLSSQRVRSRILDADNEPEFPLYEDTEPNPQQECTQVHSEPQPIAVPYTPTELAMNAEEYHRMFLNNPENPSV